MTSLSRSASLLVARTSLALVVLSFALLGVWTVGDLLGQAPDPQKRVEEEEDAPKAKAPAGQKKRAEEEEDAPKKQPKRKVIRVEDEDDGKGKAASNRQAVPAGSADLAQLAEQTTHPVLKPFFRSLAVPHDRVVFQRSSVTIGGQRQRREERIVPTPYYLGNDPGRYGHERVRFTTLTIDFQADKPLSPDPNTLEAVRPYEEIAQEKVKSFLSENYSQLEASDPKYLSHYAMLQAAEQALSSVLRWHESAIQTGKRTGREWEAVEKNLRESLKGVLLEQMKELARSKNWDGVLDLTHRLAVTYDNTDEAIFRPVVGMIQQAINDATNTEETKQQAFKRLHDLATEFRGNKALQQFSGLLQDRAKSLLVSATELAKNKDDLDKLQRAREMLKQAEETWPQLEGIGQLRAQIGQDYPILRVGIRGPLPKYFSPAWACMDNERRAMELLFESLVKLVPDGSGGFRYRPCLAEAPPKTVSLGRQFDLPRNAYWSDGRLLMSTDIDQSLGYLKGGNGLDLSRVWGDLLAPKVESMKNPYQLTLRMNQGFLDPLAPMTFKILPRDDRIEREDWAKQPVTSGPFRLDLGRSGKSDETARLTMVFVANPAYGQRLTKHGTPHIQEIRFYSYADNTDLAKELRSRNLDLVLDLTTKEAEQLQKNPDTVVPLPSATVPNRRIYFLAINTRKLDDPNLRQALSYAIDRESLLRHFRGKLTGLHKVLDGPFPAGSWASKPARDEDKNKQALFNEDLAKLKTPKGRVSTFTLKYTPDSPVVEEALKELCEKVKDRTGVVLELKPRTPYELRDDVEKAKDYELAYYHYDFTDEWFWLAPLFRPPPGTLDTNIFKYSNSQLSSLLDGMKTFRNFAKVQEYQWSTQTLLNLEMPFIPLWQLDPLMAYRTNVQPATIDPFLVFDNIEDWHLLPK